MQLQRKQGWQWLWTGLRAGVAVLVTTLVVVWALEAMSRQGLAAPLEWARPRPRELVGNLLLFVLVSLVPIALLGRLYLGLGLSAGMVLLLGLVNHYKLSLLNQPLLPWDLFLHRQAVDLAPQVWRGLGWVNLVALGAVGLVLAGLRWLLRVPRLGWTSRGVALAVGAGLLGALWVSPVSTLGTLRAWGRYQYMFWEQAPNYRHNGALLAFTMNVGSVTIRKPEGYGRGSVEAALARVGERRLAGAEREAGAAARPNVIAIMSEAFSDPTIIPGLTFSEDPLPTLHRLQKEHTSGWLYSPVYGGGTANTEFEFLTGNSMRFLPVGSIPYQQYIKRPHPSLASMFAARDYRTVALHTYYGWYWERRDVYRHLGFQKFVSSEDMPDARHDGPYISDSVITRKIIQEYEASEDPLFLFAVTMEGHGPYNAGRYPQTSIRVQGPLSEGARVSLEGYVEGLRHSDRELAALVDYFSKVPEPTIIVFFGDHLPLLTHVYKEAGVIQSGSGWTVEEMQFMYRIPLLIWRNDKAVAQDLGSLSAPMVGPHLLEVTGTPGTPYMDFLAQVREQMPLALQGMVADGKGQAYAAPPEPLKELEEQWWLLQYDQLFGDALQHEAG